MYNLLNGVSISYHQKLVVI